MGRRARYNRRDIALATAEVIAEKGPNGATMAAISEHLGAPTGSIYHRFASRDLLLGDVWLTTLEGYQAGYIEQLQRPVPDAPVHAALHIPRWVRENMVLARVLLLHRREDFAVAGWPDSYSARADALQSQMVEAFRQCCRERNGRVSKKGLIRLRFALLDVPYGAVKPYVQRGEAPGLLVDELIAQTVRATLDLQRG